MDPALIQKQHNILLDSYNKYTYLSKNRVIKELNEGEIPAIATESRQCKYHFLK
jgi:hypothetical protein